MKFNGNISLTISDFKQFDNRKFLYLYINDNDVQIVWQGIKMSDSQKFTTFNSLLEAVDAWNKDDFYDLYY